MILSERPAIQIRGGRDPFARLDVVRARVYITSETCAWCGQTRTLDRTRGGRGTESYLYRFGIWHDGGRKEMDARLFCSRECREAFNE